VAQELVGVIDEVATRRRGPSGADAQGLCVEGAAGRRGRSTMMRRAIALVGVGLAVLGVGGPVAEAQRIYVSSWNPGDLSVIDDDPASPTYHTVLASLNNTTLGFVLTAGAGVAVTPDRTRVYFLDGHQLSMIETATNTLVDLNPDPALFRYGIPLIDAFGTHGGAGLAITPDGRRALVPGCNTTSTGVRVVDVDPGSPTYHMTLAAVPVPGGCPQHVAINAAGTRAYVGHRGRTFISVIDLATLGVTNVTLPSFIGGPVFPSAIALTSDGARAYAVWEGNFLYAIDTATNTVLDLDPTSSAHYRILNCVSEGARAEAIAITPDGRRAYVMCRESSIASVNSLVKVVDLDPASPSYLTVIDTVARGELQLAVNQNYGGQLVQIAPDGTRAYLGHWTHVSVLDLVPGSPTYHQIVARIPKPGGAASGLAILPAPVNQAPVANAGTDQTVHPGVAVALNGNLSADPDGHTPLTFAWSIAEAPAGSQATLFDPTSVTPSVTPDLLGTYRIRLVVSDALGLASAPDEVMISTENSAPVADAGPDQQLIQLGTLVQLDGSHSFDDDGDDVTYAWSLGTPAGSLASLSDATAANPTFAADVQGEYRARLTVTDEFGAQSATDEVVVSFLNVAPVADAGDNQARPVGTTVQLDGGGSSDANLDPLTYQWSLASRPAGSAAALSDDATAAPTFVPDLPGTYTVSLVVNDGQVGSAPDVVTIQATTDTGALVAMVSEAITAINGLDPGELKNATMQKALTNKLAAVIADVEAGYLQDALDKLEHDVIAKTDGCAASGAPDKNDWLKTCAAQGPIYALLREAADLLQSLL
jgi:hypothetical protein